MTPTVNIILPTIRFLSVTRDIIRHVIGVAEDMTDVHVTIADGQEDTQKKEWIHRQARSLVGSGRFTYIGLNDATQRLVRAVQLESEWILPLSDDDPYSVNFVRTICDESRTASSDTMAVTPSAYLSYSPTQSYLFRLQNIEERDQGARLLALYNQAHLNGILTWSMIRRKPFLDWSEFLLTKALWPTYADQLLVSYLATKGKIVVGTEESFYAKDEWEWHDPVRAIIKDSGSYDEKHLTLFHEIFWIADLFTLLRSNGLEDGALPSLAFRAVALLQGGVAVFENRLRVLGIEQSDYSREAYAVVTKLAVLAAALADKPLEEHLRFFAQIRSIATELQTMPEGAHTADAQPHREAIGCAALPTDATPPAVSVVIPCYNQAQYLAEAVESVVAQTFHDWECIIVNDGSPDHTSQVARELIARYPDKRIRLLEKANGGLADARNAGIESSRGRYILPLDADDALRPDALTRLVEVLETQADVAIVYSDYETFGTESRLIRCIDECLFLNPARPENGLPYCSLYRRDVWSTVRGYNPNMTWGYEDYDFWIGCIEKGFRARRVPESLFLYRIKPGGMWSNALKHDAELRARIILNHPTLYNEATRRWAESTLEGRAGSERSMGKSPTENLPPDAAVVNAHLQRADERFGAGDLAAARDALLDAIRLVPGDPQLIIAYGNILLRLGDTEGARREFVKATKLAPDEVAGYLNLAAVLLMLGQAQEAEVAVRHALTLQPTDADALKLFGRLCFESGRGPEGVKAYTDALRQRPDDVETLLVLGKCAVEAGDWKTAQVTYERVLQIDPNNELTRENLAVVADHVSANTSDRARSVRSESRPPSAAWAVPVNRPAYAGEETAHMQVEITTPHTHQSAASAGRVPALTPLVSVIVPTFNRPDALVTALRSILDQSYQNFEIIVVNDAGSDIENIVRYLDKDGRITYIRHGSNRNLAAARNSGIRIARGKYIAYLDDDDLYYADHLEILVTYLQKNGSKVAYTDAHRAHQEKQGGRYVVTKRDIPYSVDFDYDRILVQNFVPVLCFMHEKACLDVVGLFDESLTTHEDWEMWIRMSRQFQLAHIKKVTCEFTSRTDGSSMSSSKRSDFLRTYAIILERHKASVSEKPHVRAAQEKVLQQILGRTAESDVTVQPVESQQIDVFLRQADECYKTGDLRKAKDALRQALQIRPDDPQLILALGNIILRLGEVEGARREFIKATTLHPEYAPAHADLAAAQLHQGHTEEAEASARRALELDSTNISALKVLARIYLNTERYQEAVQFYVTILQHAPNDIETLLLVGNCYAEAERPEEAKTFYRRVLHLDPGNAIATENLTIVSGNGLADQANVRKREASEGRSIRASIIVPVFNRLDLTRQCLDAVRRNTPTGQYELIVVDNGSSDGTAEFLRLEQDAGRLRVILNPENGGFARACNQGARVAVGTYLLFLNNDTEVQPGWFEPLVAVLDTDPAVGAAGSKLLFPNGAIQHAGVIIVDDQKSGKGLVPTHIHYREIVDPAQVNQSMTFQALTAACLLMRRSVFEQACGFEEAYRNGYEDVDLCFKIQECGWLMVYEPRSVVIHYESQSGTERFSYEKDNFERLKRTWTGRVVPDVVIRANGKLVSSNPNQVRPYQSPAHSSGSILTGSQVPLTRKGELADRSFTHGEKAPLESVAPDKVSEALRCAEGYIKNENLEAAGQVLTEAIAQTPDNLDLIMASGHVAWKQGDLEKARRQFVRAATLESDHVQAHAALAVLFLQQSRFAEAEEAARKALAVDAAEVTALKVLARICLDSERYAEAVQAYVAILREAPDDVETLLLVGNCYAEAGRPEESKTFYQRVLQLDPGNAVAAGNLAEVDRLVAASDRIGPKPSAPAVSEGRPSVSIVIVTYNSASTIRACLDSVLREARPATDLIVVDNCSVDETRSILRGYQGRITTILNPDNVGFSSACNQGIRESGGEYVVLLNPDTVVTPGWLDRLIGHFSPGVGAVGPISDYAAELQNLDRNLPDGPPRRMGLLEVTDLLSRGNAGKASETKLLTGFCFMVPRRVLDDVGLLDETLFLGNDDLELSWRLRQRGYRLMVATDTFVHHEGQVSFKSEAEAKTSRLVQESTDRLYAKLQAHYGVGNVPSPMELWGIDWFKPTEKAKGRSIPYLSRLTSIIILTHNGLEHTKKCLASIEAYTPEPHELIIVDNGSTDDTLDCLRDYMAVHDNVRVVANRTNQGFAAGNNQGLALAHGDYLLLLNNDTIVTEGWLKRMLRVFEAHPNTGIVGPMSNYVSGPQLVHDASYGGLKGLEQFAAAWARDHDGQSREATRVVGFCLLMRKEVVTRIGGLDEQFGSGNFEDDDLCIRAFRAGFLARIACDAFIHHTGSQTFKAAGIDYSRSLQRNWELFKAKWGIPADRPYEQGYRFPPQGAPDSPLCIPLPDVKTDHRSDVDGRWWQEVGEDRDRRAAAVMEETRFSAIIVPNGHGIEPLWPSLVQHTNYPLAITLAPSGGNGNGRAPLAEPACPDGWRIRSADVPRVRLLNELLRSVNNGPIVLLSSELIVTPGWLKRLLAALDRDPRVAVVGPAMNGGPGAQQVKADYKGTGKALRQFALRRAHRYGKQLAVTESLAPSCLVFNPAVCRAVWPLREDLDLAASLTDGFTRLRAAGYTVAVALDAYAHWDGDPHLNPHEAG